MILPESADRKELPGSLISAGPIPVGPIPADRIPADGRKLLAVISVVMMPAGGLANKLPSATSMIAAPP
jgi:hypothetical protein